MLEAARWLEDNTDPDARIGSFNAGIFGYFSERTVINLDGVVNEDAYRARRDGRTVEYVCAQGIRYLVDLELDSWLSAGCRDDPSLRFELVTTIGRPLFYFRGGQVDVLELVSRPPPAATEHGRQDGYGSTARPLNHAKMGALGAAPVWKRRSPPTPLAEEADGVPT
jgi:hypothetical protein